VPDANLLHHIIDRRYQIVQALSLLCNTTSDSSIVMLAIMSCSDSFDISTNSLAHSANGQSLDIISFLSRQGIITPTASSAKFKVDMETASLIRAELKSMSQFPNHLETVLRLINVNLPPDFQSSDALQQDSPYSNLAVSTLGVLMELCHESQISKSNLDVVFSMTIGITRFLSNTGLHLKAKEIIERMLDWGSDSLSSDYMTLSMLYRQLAVALRYQGHLEDAERIELEVLWLHTSHHGESHIETIRSLNNYALVLQERHKFTDAECYHSMALSMKERIFGRNHAESLISVHNLGEYFQALGQHSFAEKMFCRALSARRILFKPDHPAVLRSMNSLGVSYYLQGRYEEAEQIHKDCLFGRRKLYGDKHLETIRSTGNLALTLSHRGKVAEAEILLHKVVIAIHELLGPDQPETIKWYQNLARFLRDRNRYFESETILREWLPRVDRSLGRLYSRTVDICRELAIVLHEQEKYSEALLFAVRVRDVRIKSSGHDSAQILDSIQHVEDLQTLLQYPPCPKHF
jgi:tetratricopeptide (TPR) repeat protein